MRALSRLPQPKILTDKESEWLNSFLTSGKIRPDSSKYGNPTIRIQLNSMSFNKCFYCESKLTDKPSEIDHHIEVAIDKTLAYSWGNLYLSCDNCNGKVNHNAIPITDTLDPCRNSDKEIKDNITFEDELITARNNSAIGFKTIKKYRLDTDLLGKRRLNQLQIFYKILDKIRQNQIKGGGRNLNEKELEIINRFKQKDQPYSLMFEILIDKIPNLSL